MDKKKAQDNIDDLDDADIGSLEDRKKKIKDRFFDACKRGDMNLLNKVIDDEILDILEPDDNKWTALQWAVVNNQPEIVKILYSRELEIDKNNEDTKKNEKKEQNISLQQSEFDEAFKKPLNPADNGKYTPLHWSAYKGFDVISSILLKMGCDPLSVDSYGNNALHQASAGNHIDTFKLFMGLGIDLELKNTRSHTALDLTSNKDIEQLIDKTLSTRFCGICNKIFDFNNKRYICSIKNDIICKDCCVIGYYFPTEDAIEKDIRDCRCKNCFNEIVKAENDLQNAIDSNNLDTLNNQYEISKNFKIDLHLKKSALENQDRLTREKAITELLDSLKVVENHKTIIKSVYELDEMVRSADEHKVQLDGRIIERAYLQKNRLLAEKELRQLLANITIEMASQENLDNLNEKLNNAKESKVDNCYCDVGTDLSEKIRLNLDANDILKKFLEYPIREYPVVEEVDPKKSKIKIFLYNFIYRKTSSSSSKKEKEKEERTSFYYSRMGK